MEKEEIKIVTELVKSLSNYESEMLLISMLCADFDGSLDAIKSVIDITKTTFGGVSE